MKSGLSLSVPSTGHTNAKSREPQSSALSTVVGVGARVAPQRCPILRTRTDIVPGLATLNNCQRRPTDFFIPFQRTFWNPDLRTFYLLVDKVDDELERQAHEFLKQGPTLVNAKSRFTSTVSYETET